MKVLLVAAFVVALLFASQASAAEQQGTCAICELVIQVVESSIANNATLQKIESAVASLCAKLPSPYSTECNAIAVQNLPQIVAWLQNKEPPATICAQLKLCSSKAASVKETTTPKREVAQTPCAICELVVQVAENYIENNATFSQIEAKMDALCGDLPAPYNGECTLIVNSYLPQIVAWIATNEPPATICAQLSLCTSKKPAPKPKREVAQTPCAVCELVVQVAENYLENNATFSQIEAKLDGLCGDLPAPYNGECTLIVNSYLPQIVAWLEANEPPATLCAQLSLCSSKNMPKKETAKRAVEQTPCAVCELVVQVAETYIENNATFSQIEAKMDALCGDLPAPYNGECTLIVNSYLPQIVAWIATNEPPATVCAQLSLCSSKKAAPSPKREVEGTVCAVCELVVQVAESYVEQNQTLSAIEAKLDAVCGALPAPYNAECTLIVNSYLPQIVTWLENNEPPHTLCGQLALCSSKKAAPQPKREAAQTPCAVCELVVQVAETYLANNSTQSQIEAKLDAVCGDLPAPYNGECVLIVNAYLPQIITWLENNEPPATLCAQLSLCSSKKEEKKN